MGDERQHKGLKAATRIGTIHGRHNYTLRERAFHDSDVNPVAREKKMQVKQASKKNILGNGRLPWQSETNLHDKATVRRSCQIPAYDRSTHKFNYRAEVLPAKQPDYIPKAGRYDLDLRAVLKPGLQPKDMRLPVVHRAKEVDVNPALVDKPAWNGSTEIDLAQRRHDDEHERHTAMRHSKAKNKSLSGEGYVSPELAQMIRLNKMREEKERRRKGLPATTDEPPSTKSVQEDQTPDPVHKPRRGPSRKYKEYYNDGVYEYSKIEGCYVWSCSMNTNPDFRGSCYRVRNPDAWNFASP